MEVKKVTIKKEELINFKNSVQVEDICVIEPALLDKDGVSNVLNLVRTEPILFDEQDPCVGVVKYKDSYVRFYIDKISSKLKMTFEVEHAYN